MKMKVTVTDKGLYVPYEQNFVTETMFHFLSAKTMHKYLQQWTDLKPPDRIRADSLFTDDTAELAKIMDCQNL